MRTLNITITDFEYNKLGISTEKLTFNEFTEIVRTELMRQNLEKCIELAQQYKLSEMTMDEISDEVKAVRDAKSRN